MAGFGNFDETVVANGVDARIVLRDGSEALKPPEEQGGRGDLAVDLSSIIYMVAEGRDGAHVVIELPDEGTIGTPIRAVKREMAGDLIREVRVGFLHARHSGVQAGIAAHGAFFNIAHVLN